MQKPKRLVTIDFETFYSKDYTLSKSSTSEYIRDPRFQTIGVGVKDGSSYRWYEEADFRTWTRSVDWSEVAVLAHHTHFDGLILAHHFDIRPSLWLDTLSMARAIHGTEVGGSLKALAEKYGLGQKGDEVVRALGKRRADFTLEEWTVYGNYCLNDVRLTYGLFRELAKGFPEDELRLIDLTIRMFTEPVFRLDQVRMQALVASERKRKAELLERCAKDSTSLSSNQQFAALLLELGVEPPTKISPKTGKETYAFAKTDPGMMELLESEREDVRWLAEARVGVKSTINETRAERLLRVGSTGPVPVYLKFYGAHTGRWSGGDGTNLQNPPRGGEIRKALCAPPGYVVVACDSNAIEARGVAWLAGQDDLVADFAAGRDAYCRFASLVYGYQVKKDTHPLERRVGKTSVLGLGYGMGWKKFASTLAAGPGGEAPIIFDRRTFEQLGGAMLPFEMRYGVQVEDMPSRLPLDQRMVHCATAWMVVNRYRKLNSKIPALWRKADRLIEAMVTGERLELGPVHTERHALVLPNGMRLRYPGLAREDDGFTFLSGRARKRVPIHGGVLVENIIQALARIVIGEQVLVAAGLGANVATTTHDEIVIIVKEGQGEQAAKQLEEIMSVTPVWAKGWPLAAEAGFGATYGDT